MHEFLHLLRQDIPFHWDQEAQDSIEALKNGLSQEPLIIPPNYNKEYTLYLSAFEVAIVGVLIQEGSNNRDHVIYYISKNLFGPALKYEPSEKTTLALVHFVQKL